MAGQASGPVYVIDSSSWITIEGHPAQNRLLWLIGQLIETGRIICPPEVEAETELCDGVNAWLAQYKNKHVRRLADADYFLMVGRVTAQFPGMAGARGGKDKADPYVVAMAAHLNQKTKHVAVSEEGFRRPSRKISTACAAFGVEHKNLVDMLRDEFPEEDF
jgi:hypothetical protein